MGLVVWPICGDGGPSARDGLAFAVRGKGSESLMEGGPLETGLNFLVSESTRGAVAGGDNGSYVSPPDEERLCSFFSRRDAFAAFLRAVLDGLAWVSLRVWK